MESNIGELMEKDGRMFFITSFSLHLDQPATAIEVVKDRLEGPTIQIETLVEYNRIRLAATCRADLITQVFDR